MMVSLSCGRDANGIPYAGKRVLNQFAVEMLRDFRPETLEKPQPTDIEALAEFYFGANVEYRPITLEQKILGATVFDGGVVTAYDRLEGYIQISVPPKTVLIEQGIMNNMEPGRYRFTLAHEVAGHLGCHSDIKMCMTNALRIAGESGARVVMCRPDESNYLMKNKTPEQWMEWQADYMGSAVLMPEPTFIKAFEMLFSHYGLYVPSLAVSAMRENKNLYFDMVRNLARVFQVSNTAARIRVDDLILS